MEKRRNYKIDNIKALLIFLVVFAHNMEPFYKGSIRFMYLFIYLFHMPLFILCTGYFAKFSMDRVKYKILYPYIIFQAAYLLFEVLYYKESDYPITLFSPYWILWYLFSFFFWMMAMPFIGRAYKKRKNILILILISLIIGIGIGFDNQIGRDFSLSRTMVFWPYFLLGHAMRQYEDWDLLQRKYKKGDKQKSIILLIFIILLYSLTHKYLSPKAVYGAYSYSDCGMDWYIRVFLYFMGIFISLCIIIWMPKRRIVFSYLGQNSMQIFLLHGFIIKILRKIDIYKFLKGEIMQWLFLVASTVVLVIFLGSSWIKKRIAPFIQYPGKKGGENELKIRRIR